MNIYTACEKEENKYKPELFPATQKKQKDKKQRKKKWKEKIKCTFKDNVPGDTLYKCFIHLYTPFTGETREVKREKYKAEMKKGLG